MLKYAFRLYWGVALSLLIGACKVSPGLPPADIASRPINVVATTSIVADVVAQVGGDRVLVTSLMGAGIDPHLYKASEGDMLKLQNADIVFYSGLHLEAQMGKVLEQMNLIGRITVAVTSSIAPEQLLGGVTYTTNHDPHVWFDVTLWMKTVAVIQTALTQMDPSHAAVYEQNAQRYQASLQELHAYVLAQAQRVPVQQRVIITAHDAFRYFGRAYGFEVRGLQGISTESQAGTADVQSLTEFIVTRRIPAIFVETSIPQRNIEAVQAAVQAQSFQVKIGGSLFSDALGSPDTPAGTYIGMVRYNIDTIVNALLQ